jgi:hypothetical protein
MYFFLLLSFAALAPLASTAALPFSPSDLSVKPVIALQPATTVTPAKPRDVTDTGDSLLKKTVEVLLPAATLKPRTVLNETLENLSVKPPIALQPATSLDTPTVKERDIVLDPTRTLTRDVIDTGSLSEKSPIALQPATSLKAMVRPRDVIDTGSLSEKPPSAVQPATSLKAMVRPRDVIDTGSLSEKPPSAVQPVTSLFPRNVIDTDELSKKPVIAFQPAASVARAV